MSAPMPVLGQLFQEDGETLWTRSLGPVNAVEMLAGGYAAYWARTWDTLRPGLVAAGVELAVRWAWVPPAPRGLGIELPVERNALAISLLTALARFPGATVLAHLNDLTRGQDRQVTPAWYELQEVAGRVAGLTFEREVASAGSSTPRLAGPEGTRGFAFTGEGRRVQFLSASPSAVVRFTPARPGTLTARSATEAKSESRVLVTTETVDVPLAGSAAVYQELAPVSARRLDGPPAELTGQPAP